jgi:hypothetical protein
MTVRMDVESPVRRTAARRPMLTVCPVAGCRRLTMGGGTCVEHDAPVTVTFPRGRPFVSKGEVAAVGPPARVVPLG